MDFVSKDQLVFITVVFTTVVFTTVVFTTVVFTTVVFTTAVFTTVVFTTVVFTTVVFPVVFIQFVCCRSSRDLFLYAWYTVVVVKLYGVTSIKLKLIHTYYNENYF